MRRGNYDNLDNYDRSPSLSYSLDLETTHNFATIFQRRPQRLAGRVLVAYGVVSHHWRTHHPPVTERV